MLQAIMAKIDGCTFESSAASKLENGHEIGFRHDSTIAEQSQPESKQVRVVYVLSVDAGKNGAGRGTRTPTGLSALRILSPLRLPVSPSRLTVRFNQFRTPWQLPRLLSFGKIA